MHSRPRPSDHHPEWQRQAIQGAIRRLVPQERIGHYLRDDLEQDLVIHWWQHGHRFKPGGPANERTYFVRVIENKLRDIIRKHSSASRGGAAHTGSLDLQEDGDLPLHERVASRERSLDEHAAARQRRAAVQRWVRRLSPRDQETVLAIYQEPTMQAAADRLGIRRTSLYDRLERLQRLARDAGLEKFL